jgi:hypothetical protein
MKPNEFNLASFYNGVMKGENPLYAYQYVVQFLFPNEYSELTTELQDTKNPSNNLTYYVQTAKLPGVELTTAKNTFFGTEFRYPGVAKYNHTWDCNIILTQDLRIYHILSAWMKHISSLEKSGGGSKSVPPIKVLIGVLDPTGETIVRTIVLEGVWLSKLGKMSFKYTQGGGDAIKSFSISFKYQYNYIGGNDDGNVIDTDPLNPNKIKKD